MATTVVTGTFLSDAIVGAKEDVTQDMMALARADAPFLNAIGFGDLGRSVTAYSQTHKWVDLSYKHNKCVLNTTVSNSDTTFVFTGKGFLAGDFISIEGEIVKLGDMNVDGVTFGAGGTACTRSVGTPAAAAHTAGVTAVLVARPVLEGASASTQGPTHEPSLTTNYCQIFERTITTSWQALNTARHGRPGTAYDDKALECMAQLKLEIQSAMYAGGAATAPAPASSTKGTMKGLRELAIAASSYTALSGASLKESNLATAAEAMSPYQDINGFNAVIVIPPAQVKTVRQWQMPHLSGTAQELQGRYGVPVRQVDLGLMVADVIAWDDMTSHADVCCFIPSFVKPVTLEGCGVQHTALGVTGQTKSGLISYTGSVELHGEGKAAYILTGVAVS